MDTKTAGDGAAAPATAAVRLRGLRDRDTEQLADLFGCDSVVWGTTFVPYPSELEVREMLAPSPERHWIVAEDPASGRAVGFVRLDWGKGRWRRVAKVLMAVHGDAAGAGIGRRLLEAAVNVAFRWLDMQRIELELYVDNLAALRLYERMGFVHEGTKRAISYRDGRYVDGFTMALLRDDARDGARTSGSG